MSASNTNILIKRSSVTTAPSSLKAGELAYSYLSNTAFIGTADGTGVVKIGGQAYTSQIDNATSAATGLTLVQRDASVMLLLMVLLQITLMPLLMEIKILQNI